MDWTPFLIFAARLCDMTLDTLRVIYVTRGNKYKATLLGFVETLIWVFAIAQVVNNLDNYFNAIAYAGGFAAGTFVGIFLEGKMALGKVVVQIITRKDASNLIDNLHQANYSFTTSDGQGLKGQVKIIFTVIPKKKLFEVDQMVKKHNPNAFVSISEVKQASEDALPAYKRFSGLFWMQLWKR
ncbi:MAG: DUF2179 domain-containing protein [Bdellovibrionales bacterium]|nr:DUF2179 domain-containing protein [Bdellovibrionales bacterium]